MAAVAGPASSTYKYLVVLDFEATCDDPGPLEPQEIIEFPSVLIDVEKKAVVDEFQSYVRPQHHPRLTAFCTQLTGITQEMVDPAPTFPSVFEAYNKWLAGHGLTPSNAVFVTCGDWDLRRMLPAQLSLAGMTAPALFKRWVNIKILASNFYHVRIRGMTDLLARLKLSLEGRHHSGIDDSRNIARCALRLLQDGASFEPTGLSR